MWATSKLLVIGVYYGMIQSSIVYTDVKEFIDTIFEVELDSFKSEKEFLDYYNSTITTERKWIEDSKECNSDGYYYIAELTNKLQIKSVNIVDILQLYDNTEGKFLEKVKNYFNKKV